MLLLDGYQLYVILGHITPPHHWQGFHHRTPHCILLLTQQNEIHYNKLHIWSIKCLSGS